MTPFPVANAPAQAHPSGRLVLVVGPSGAGKDTLLARARAACGTDEAIAFARRSVTREASVAEDHLSLSEAEFARACAAGAYAVTWEAHGLKYGIPASIETDLAAGRTVVCNVSRNIVADLRQRYARCQVVLHVVLVTAPEELRRARLAARARPSDGDAAQRAATAAPSRAELDPALVIENSGTIEAAAAALLAFLRQPSI